MLSRHHSIFVDYAGAISTEHLLHCWILSFLTLILYFTKSFNWCRRCNEIIYAITSESDIRIVVKMLF